MEEKEPKKLDETIPGGKYIVGGELVNGKGEPLKKQTEEETEDKPKVKK